MRILIFVLLATTLVLSTCGNPGEIIPAESLATLTTNEHNSVTASPTATIIWFPATNTWTPSPILVPSTTPELLPGMGAQVYQDDFSKVERWSQAAINNNGENNIILDRNRLTLAINLTPATLFSMNNDLTLTNFRADMMVSVNRCFGPDIYGLLFRAASGRFAYRFLLNCAGKVRVELAQEGRITPLQDWVPSGDAPAGAPGLVKMSIWVAGTEMRFFLNDRYQFTVFNPVFKNGGLGVFAGATSPDGANISFSNLTVYSVDYFSPTPTATPSKTATPTRTPRSTP